LEDIGYIGYREAKVGDLFSSGASAAATSAAAFAQGGLNIGADIAALASVFSFGANLWNQWTSHPARDARDLITNLKPSVSNLDPYNRLIQVIATSQKISESAGDVDAQEWLLWYKQSFPNDYQTLSADNKIYYNNYLESLKKTHPNTSNLYAILDSSKFTTSEINYNASPITSLSNLFTSTGISTNTVIYIAIGLGLYLLIKK
jgi:hypothetical protein